jgi:hypothetical protein
MLSLIFVSFQVEANLSNVLILEIKLSRVDWDQEGRWIGIKREGGLGSRGKVDWDAINPATLDIPMTYVMVFFVFNEIK